TELPASLLGANTYYLANSAPVLAVCVGLAFWPVIGEQDPYRVRRPRSVPLAVSAFALTGAFLVGSIWSGVTYLSNTSSARTCWPVRSAATRIPLSAYVFRYAWIIQLSYSGPATTLQLELGTAVRDVVLPAGQRDVYIPISGGGSAVLVRSLSGEPAACIAR